MACSMGSRTTVRTCVCATPRLCPVRKEEEEEEEEEVVLIFFFNFCLFVVVLCRCLLN